MKKTKEKVRSIRFTELEEAELDREAKENGRTFAQHVRYLVAFARSKKEKK